MESGAGSSISYKFIGRVDEDLECLICLDVARDPLQHEVCGKLFCKECLEKHGKHKPCPHCKQEQPRFFLDVRGNRTIQALCVKCANDDRGCEWEGTVGVLKQHMAICQFTLQPCPNKCNRDNKLFTREDLSKHLKKYCPKRPYKCKRCGEKGTYLSITHCHEKLCTKKPIFCSNAECTEIVQQQGLKRHLETCEFTKVPCKYQRLGCEAVMKRREMPQHEGRNNEHLCLALNKVLTMEAKLEKIEVTMNSLTYKFDEIRKKKESKNDFYTPTFYSSPKGYCMRIKLYVMETESEKIYLSVCPGILKGEFDEELKWPLVGKMTCKILNQVEDEQHLKRTIDLESLVPGTFLGYTSFLFEAHELAKNTHYLKDDTLYLGVMVDIPDSKPWLECTGEE